MAWTTSGGRFCMSKKMVAVVVTVVDSLGFSFFFGLGSCVCEKKRFHWAEYTWIFWRQWLAHRIGHNKGAIKSRGPRLTTSTARSRHWAQACADKKNPPKKSLVGPWGLTCIAGHRRHLETVASFGKVCPMLRSCAVRCVFFFQKKPIFIRFFVCRRGFFCACACSRRLRRRPCKSMTP